MLKWRSKLRIENLQYNRVNTESEEDKWLKNISLIKERSDVC